ncbi:MAG: carboxypeptidase regulatory-like domain-containing protein [Planctomycetota bacterium]|jgi:protocatechuate 3,4-dioxygenase beta subunit
MNRDEARLLAIRAADGELNEAEGRRLAAALRADPELRAFLEREKEAAAAAGTVAAALRLPPGGLEEEVLARMGMRRPHRKLLLGSALVAAALLVGLVYLMAGEDEHARAGRRAPTASFEPLVGGEPEVVDRGAYHLAQGTSRVTVDHPTLVETEAGVVQLQPGRYEIKVERNRLTVTVFEGAALLRNDEDQKTVAEGRTESLVRRGRPPLVAETPTRAGPGARITGRVTDGKGTPLPDARIWMSRGPGTEEGETVARTDAEGRYQVDGVAGAVRLVGVRATGFAPTDLRRIEPARQAVFEMDFTLRHRGGALSVAVRDDAEQPISGATVLIGAYYRNLPVRQQSPEGYPLSTVGPRRVVSDAQGIAFADGLPPEWNKLRVYASGLAAHHGWVRIPPEGSEERTIRLSTGATVSGTVRGADGARIVFFDTQGARIGGVPETRTAADGTFRVEHAPTGKVQIRALADDGAQAAAWLHLEPGEERRWEASLESAYAIEGRLLYDDGAPVVKALVWCRPVHNYVDGPAYAFTDAEGAFRFDKRGNELHEVSVWYPGPHKARRLPPARRVRLVPDESPLTLRLPQRAEEPEPGFLAGIVALPDGAPAADARIRVWPAAEGGWMSRALAGADGSFRFGPLAPGAYRLEIHRDGQPTLHEDVAIPSGRTQDLGTVRFPTGGRIRARVFGSNGQPFPESRVSVASLDQSVYFTSKLADDGSALSEALAPGRYLVFFGASGLVEEVGVAAGETTEVELHLRAGSRLVLTITLADGSAPRYLSYRFEDQAGRRVFYGDLSEGENEVKVWLVEGTYTIHCSDRRGREAEATLAVSGQQPVTQVQLTLR